MTSHAGEIIAGQVVTRQVILWQAPGYGGFCKADQYGNMGQTTALQVTVGWVTLRQVKVGWVTLRQVKVGQSTQRQVTEEQGTVKRSPRGRSWWDIVTPCKVTIGQVIPRQA